MAARSCPGLADCGRRGGSRLGGLGPGPLGADSGPGRTRVGEPPRWREGADGRHLARAGLAPVPGVACAPRDRGRGVRRARRRSDGIGRTGGGISGPRSRAAREDGKPLALAAGAHPRATEGADRAGRQLAAFALALCICPRAWARGPLAQAGGRSPEPRAALPGRELPAPSLASAYTSIRLPSAGTLAAPADAGAVRLF